MKMESEVPLMLRADWELNLNSGIYQGQIRHRRFSPKQHNFSYQMYMLALDIDELPQLNQQSWLFKVNRWAPLRFDFSDHFPNATDPNDFKRRIKQKVAELGGTSEIDRITLLTQVRCFGVYFSPINFYFCYQQDELICMLAEVSNTPWQQKHFYLVENTNFSNDKDFHVSPFMPMNMQYKWRLTAPNKRLLVHIENHQSDKVFDATLSLSKVDFNNNNLLKTLIKHPLMTTKIMSGIYWQALKMVLKRFVFIPHPNS